MTSAIEPTSENRKPPAAGAHALFAAIAAIAVGLSATPATAQTIDYGALQQLFGEPVTTIATGSPQRATNVPANMEIITADDILRSGADNIPDILQFVAGVDVRRYSFAQTDVSVRGYDQPDSPRLLVLINGRQVYLDDYGYTAWASLPVQMEEIRQIEIVKGPNSALFGFNASGGVINIITFDPLLDSTNEATVRGGTQGYASGSAVMTIHDGDQAGLRLSAGGFRAGEFSTSGVPAALGAFDRTPDQYSFSAAGTLMPTPKIALTAEATAVNLETFEVSPLPSFADEAVETNSLKFGLAADTGYGLLNLTAYRNELEFTDQSTVPEPREDNQTYVVQASDVFKLDDDDTIRLGVEYRDVFDNSALVGGSIGYTVYSASAMWDWQILPQLTLTNALRFDRLGLRYDGTTAPGDRYSISNYNDAVLTEPSFNSGLVYKPTDDDTVRLLAARGIQAPSLLDLGFQASYHIGGFPVAFIGSPDLSAASVMNFEIDYDRTLSPSTTLRAAVFDQNTNDLLASALNTPLAPGAGGLVSYSENVGNSTADGAEIELKGAIEQGVRWSVSYSYISISDHLILSSTIGLSGLLDYAHGSPESVVDAGLGYSWDRFDADAQARWQSQFVDFEPTVGGGAEPFTVDDYVTMNARIGYRITDSLTLAVTGDELLQSRIFETAGLPVDRRIMASISSRF
jgi:iron complex outermembrane receptor protein